MSYNSTQSILERTTANELEEKLQHWAAKLQAALPRFLEVYIKRADRGEDGDSTPCRHSLLVRAKNGVVLMTGIVRLSADDEDALDIAADDFTASVVPYRVALRQRSDHQICQLGTVWPTDSVLLAGTSEEDMEPDITRSTINFSRRSDKAIILTGSIVWQLPDTQGPTGPVDQVIPTIHRMKPSEDLYYFVCDKDISIYRVSPTDSSTELVTELEYADVDMSKIKLYAMRNLLRLYLPIPIDDERR